MTIMIIVMGMTIICEILSYALQIIFFKMQIEIIPFLRIVGIETLYNVMIVIIIYPIMQKGGQLIERIFTENKTFTRYF